MKTNKDKTMRKKTYKPYLAPIAIHPGETLLDEIEYLNVSQAELAIRTGLTEKHISKIVNGEAPITPDTAIKIEKAIGLNANGMLNLQAAYEETVVRLKVKENLREEIKLLPKFKETFSELVKIECLKPLRSVEKNFSDIVQSLQSFYGVSSLLFVQETNLSAAYRKYKAKNVNQNTVAAWLRLGQLKAQKTDVSPYDEKKLKNSLQTIKTLSKEKPESYLPKLEKILADCGIVLVCAPYLKNTQTQGATKWEGSKAFIILKTTNQSEDKFWFNLFHELGHILKHGKSQTYIHLEDDRDSKEEKEANEFAQKQLMPGFDISKISPNKIDKSYIKNLAQTYEISPSIVAGRLAYELEDYRSFNHLIKQVNYKNICLNNLN